MSSIEDVAAADRRPRPIPDVWAVELDGELVVYNPLDGAVHEMDRLGSLVWPFLDGEATVGELVGDLADAFEIPAEAVRADLAEFLGRLDIAGLLVDRTTPVAPPGGVTFPLITNRRATPGYLADPPAP
jgi:hypothetical protein